MRFNVAARTTAFVSNVVVPAAISTVVVVTQDDSVLSEGTVSGVLYVTDTMELFSYLSFYNLVLLWLKISSLEVEMKLVVSFVRRYDFGLFHVKWNGEYSWKSEVGVLDVFAINLFVDVEQVRIFEFFNGLVGDFTGPIVHAKSSVFKDHLLQVVELVAPIVVCFKGS